MRKKSDPRHKRRQKAIQMLFSAGFIDGKIPSLDKEARSQVSDIVVDKTKIDTLIEEAAPEFPIEKINKIDLAILRLAVYELIERKNPEKVVIDEAIELGKEFGGDTSPGFINGVLGKILTSYGRNSRTKSS